MRKYSKDFLKKNNYTNIEYILYRFYVCYFIEKNNVLHIRYNFLNPICWVLMFYLIVMTMTIKIVSIFSKEK